MGIEEYTFQVRMSKEHIKELGLKTTGDLLFCYICILKDKLDKTPIMKNITNINASNVIDNDNIYEVRFHIEIKSKDVKSTIKKLEQILNIHNFNG
jgi:hypothetical protein